MVDSRTVASVVVEIGDRVIAPRFRRLQPDQITAKDTPGDPEDVVTIADREAERALIDALDQFVPGAAFIGEEAVSGDPTLLDALDSSRPAWLIDPIDGTKNFARGLPQFGVMLALVEAGVSRASWMYMPAMPAGRLVTSEQSAGTWMDGRLLHHTERPVRARPRGTIHTRLMPRTTATDVVQRLDGRIEHRPSTGAAAIEYAEILSGEKDFVIYYRLLPWDHAPGALALSEAGGAALHLDGLPYTPRSVNQVTIFAATVELADTIRRWLAV